MSCWNREGSGAGRFEVAVLGVGADGVDVRQEVSATNAAREIALRRAVGRDGETERVERLMETAG
jgi:hypothetical protein